MSSEPISPQSTEDVRQAVADAVGAGQPLEIRGGGSKASIGAPHRTGRWLEMSALDRVIDYDPAELVLTVEAGARLDVIEAMLAEKGQMLAFEPFDYAALLGGPGGRSTIGGVIAAGVSGSRRVSAGAARDHFLGFEAVSGRAERFIGGARVVKNVTGFDLPKVMAGSWGRLAVLTTVTVKVLPRPQAATTLSLEGLGDRQATAAMAAAMGSPAAVAAAAHLPDHQGRPITLLRLEGVASALPERVGAIAAAVADFGPAHSLDDADAASLWIAVRDAAPLASATTLWRVNLAPSQGPEVTEALAPYGAEPLYDWAGGLVWLATPEGLDPALVRQVAQQAGGHAMLVRAPVALRERTLALHPESPAIQRLSDRVKAAFDPNGVFDPDRFRI